MAFRNSLVQALTQNLHNCNYMVNIDSYLVGNFRCNNEQFENRVYLDTKDGFFGSTGHSRNALNCSIHSYDMDAMHECGLRMDFEDIAHDMSRFGDVALLVE